MAKIRSHDAKAEVWFRKKLFALGYRYRTNVANVPGHPDIYLAKYHTAVFVHGCFWHRHSGCKYAYTPKSRVDFWQKKFHSNMDRDAVVKQSLYESGMKAHINGNSNVTSIDLSPIWKAAAVGAGVGIAALLLWHLLRKKSKRTG